MTTDTFPLPSTYAYGKVVGRIIYAIGDTAEDADDKPQARAAAGTVTFTPMATGAKVTTADYTAIIMNGAVKANLSSSGRILDAEGRQGIWLIQGIYRVDFSFTATSDGLRGSLPPFQIEVLPAHQPRWGGGSGTSGWTGSRRGGRSWPHLSGRSGRPRVGHDAVSVDRQGRRDCRVDRNTVRVAGCILGMGGCLRSLGRHDGRG